MARWQADPAWPASPAEVAFSADDSRPAAALGAESFFACVGDALRWWPPLRNVRATSTLALEADGRLDSSPNATRSWVSPAGAPTLRMSVTNLLDVALHEIAATLQQLRAACGLSGAEERALRALHGRLSATEQHTDHARMYSLLNTTLFAARREAGAADVARHGLRACALPGCGATEPYPKAFKLCGCGSCSCRGAAYCCAQHSADDWRRHKREDRCTPPA